MVNSFTLSFKVRRKPYYTNDISKHPVMNKSKLVSSQHIYLDCRKLIELDVHAVRALCKHWVIIVEQKENEIVIELYAKE